MKNAHFLTMVLIVIMIDSCASNKATPVPERTLAQVCFDSFPCKDSIQFIEVEVEVAKTETVYIDSTECPPSDTGTVVIQTRVVNVPGRTIKTIVMVPAQIDSALRQSYRDLQRQYEITIKALEDCKSSQKQKAKPPKQDWKVWLIAIGLLVVVLTQLFNRKN